MLLFSVLIPAKAWFAPDQALEVNVKADKEVTLVLTTFAGKAVEAKGEANVNGEKVVDVKTVFPALATPGTYLLYAVPKGSAPGGAAGGAEFVGTPLVIGVREDTRRGAPPGVMVVKVEPLRYAVMKTEAGDLTCVFYYDVAPNTAASFLALAENGYYDGLKFHRIMPGFVIQGGDPRGDGTGGPGYHIQAEFSDRPHEAGVLSMARNGDPNEATGAMPRPEFADSAGSQFFVCLNYERTRALDGKYTAFGKVLAGAAGMDAVNKIAETPIADKQSGRPVKAPVITKVEVKSVTAADNPYKHLAEEKEPKEAGKGQ